MTSENLPLPARIVLPEIFSWPAQDIADNTGNYEIKRGCDVEAAKLYLAIFAGRHFSRVVLGDGSKVNEEKRRLLAAVQNAQDCLIKYLDNMVAKANPHIVRIGQDMGLQVDGKAVELVGAGVRAVLALALMRGREWFLTTDFNDLFYGSTRAKGEPASEFTTAIRAASNLLPHLHYDSDYKGRRRVSAVYLDVAASDAQLNDTLARMLPTSA